MDITADLPINNNITISVANMQSRGFSPIHDPVIYMAWNHGKFTLVDDENLLVGGQQYDGTSYLGTNQVNDSVINIYGPIAKDAKNYANLMWSYVNSHKGLLYNFCFTYKNGKINSTCLFDGECKSSLKDVAKE